MFTVKFALMKFGSECFASIDASFTTAALENFGGLYFFDPPPLPDYFSLSRLRLRYWPILLLPHLRRHRKWSRLLFKRSASAECMAYCPNDLPIATLARVVDQAIGGIDGHDGI
jgi:hypothetical protein